MNIIVDSRWCLGTRRCAHKQQAFNAQKMISLYSIGLMWSCAGNGRISKCGSPCAMLNFNLSVLMICLRFLVEIIWQLILYVARALSKTVKRKQGAHAIVGKATLINYTSRAWFTFWVLYPKKPGSNSEAQQLILGKSFTWTKWARQFQFPMSTPFLHPFEFLIKSLFN